MKKMFKTVFLATLFIALTLGSSAFAQTATVTGSVMRQDGRAAANVTVTVSGHVSFTDVSGRYRIDKLKFGNHTMELKENGQVVAKIPLQIDAPRVKKNATIP